MRPWDIARGWKLGWRKDNLQSSHPISFTEPVLFLPRPHNFSFQCSAFSWLLTLPEDIRSYCIAFIKVEESTITATIMMQPAEDDDEIFVYMGGDQEVPDGVRRARIHQKTSK